jgi:RNA polymerase sigma-70 factor (sigma-E family)
MARTESDQDDDAARFSQFVTARSDALVRTAYLLVGERGLAQDLLQEALTKTWAAWGRIREPERAEAYCRTALTRTAISWYRRKSWQGERPSETLPERLSDGHEDGVAEQDHLRQALMSLPPRQRAAVVCRYYDDLSEAETAAVMGCAVG